MNTIPSLQQVEEQFRLTKTIDPTFFTEWNQNLLALTAAEEANCDRIKASYLHNSYNGSLTDSTINLLLLSPLLYLSGFCDPPFRLPYYSMTVPQLLTYMMGNPEITQPIYGMVTNGDTFLFIKLDNNRRTYALSDDFSLFRQSQNELYGVLRVLKQLKHQPLLK